MLHFGSRAEEGKPSRMQKSDLKALNCKSWGKCLGLGMGMNVREPQRNISTRHMQSGGAGKDWPWSACRLFECVVCVSVVSRGRVMRTFELTDIANSKETVCYVTVFAVMA